MRNDRRRNRIGYWLSVEGTEKYLWCMYCKKFVDVYHFDNDCHGECGKNILSTKKKLDSSIRRLYKEQHENKDLVYKIIKFINKDTVEVLKYKFI